MELKNSFEVPVGVAQAWLLLLDVEQVALCMPGATLDSVNGDEMTGRVKVKLGPIAMTYQGTVRFLQQDENSHSLVMEAAGTDMKGAGGASARVKMRLEELTTDRTRCELVTDLAVTGKPAQFGRGVMADVSNRLIGQFAERLAEEALSPARRGQVPSGVQDTPARPAPAISRADEDDAIDLLSTIGRPSLAMIGSVGLLSTLVLVVFLVRRRSQSSQDVSMLMRGLAEDVPSGGRVYLVIRLR